MPETANRFAGPLYSLLAIAVAAGVAWLLFQPAKSFRDDTPLPRGSVSLPDGSTLKRRSELGVMLRMDINALANLISKVSYSFKQGNDEGTIRLNDIQLAPKDDSHLQIKEATAVFDGSYHTLVRTINSACADLTKSTLSPQIDEQWVLRMNPDVNLEVTRINENKTLLDKTLVALANTFFTGKIRNLIESEAKIPLKGFVQQLWDRNATAKAKPLGNAEASLSLRPITINVIQPDVDKQASTIRMGFGVGFDSVLWIGTDIVDVDPPTPLPAVEELQAGEQPQSRLRLPVVVDLNNLGDFWEPLPVASVSRDFRIESIEMTEKDGLLHGRLNFSGLRAPGWWPLLPKTVRGVVQFQARPTCDSERGRLAIADFAFTQRSNSLLVDLLGDQSNRLIRAAIEDAVPTLSDAIFRRAEVAARAKVNELLNEAIVRWAKSVPKFSADLARAAADVSGIELKPIDAEVRDGHLIVTLQADAKISIHLKGPASEPAAPPSTDD